MHGTVSKRISITTARLLAQVEHRCHELFHYHHVCFKLMFYSSCRPSDSRVNLLVAYHGGAQLGIVIQLGIRASDGSIML